MIIGLELFSLVVFAFFETVYFSHGFWYDKGWKEITKARLNLIYINIYY